jgi:peptidyl-lysine (3S)-dioxygenase / protease
LPLADDAFGPCEGPEAVNLWVGDERSVSSIHKDHFENMYAVVYGEKTFTLLPPTDIAFLEEREYATKRYVFAQGDNQSATSTIGIGGRAESVFACAEDGSHRTGSHRIHTDDLVLESIQEESDGTGPPSSIRWIATDPDDPEVLEKSPSFRYAHPVRCTVRAGEVLYIPAMWYHQVSQTTLTIAVNYWYDQRFDFRYVFYQHMKRSKCDSIANGGQQLS